MEMFQRFVLAYFQNIWNIYLFEKSLKLIFMKYQRFCSKEMQEKYEYMCSTRPIGQFLAKFRSCHTKFLFGRKLYPLGPPMGCTKLCTGPKCYVYWQLKCNSNLHNWHLFTCPTVYGFQKSNRFYIFFIDWCVGGLEYL